MGGRSDSTDESISAKSSLALFRYSSMEATAGTALDVEPIPGMRPIMVVPETENMPE